MNKKYFQTRLLSLVKPDSMSNEEYVLRCAANGVNASTDDPQYMHWVIGEAYSDFSSTMHQKVRDLIVKGLKQHLLLDFTDDECCEYICDLLPDIVLNTYDGIYDVEQLFRVILEEYRDTKLGEVTYHLNKGLGITECRYFD